MQHKDVNYDPLQHPSIVEIKREMEIESEKSFVFQKVTEQNVEKIVNNINIKKATGVDGIPAKVVKNCKEAIIPNLTLLINLSVENCIFPDRLKQAQVTPLHRKNNPLEKSNYRPVSVLPIFSKKIEKVMEIISITFFIHIYVLFERVMDA